MLTAKYKDTGEEIIITNLLNPRAEIDQQRLCCKFCEGKMGIRQGMLRAKHFFHLSACTSDFERHPESIQHNIGKQLIGEHIKEFWTEYAQAEIRYELALPEIKRIADITMIFPSGWLVVHEIQLAGITVEKLIQRTNDYQRIGIDTFWWLGKSADTTGNRNWCIDNFGYSLSIDYATLDSRAKDLLEGRTQGY